MKTIQRNITYLGFLIFLSIFLPGALYAQKPEKQNHSNNTSKIIDLGCITRQVSVKGGQNKGLFIKSKKFVFYVNRKQKDVMIGTNRISFSRGNNITTNI
jgi:hypothetical protein